jgi:sialidase-1
VLDDLTTGLIYRNPKPHVRSVHAYFPSVVALPSGKMLASFSLAEAFEAANMRTHVARSTDGGQTWSLPAPLYPGTPHRLTSDAARLAAMPDGQLAVLMLRHDRTNHPDEGLTSPATLGFVPTELLLLRSADGGQTWSAPQPILPPLEGPSFELCSPIVPLSDGRWLLPTSTWRGWDGACPNGMKAIALISRDGAMERPADFLRGPELPRPEVA